MKQGASVFAGGGRAAMLLTYDEGNFPATARSSHSLMPYLRLHLDEQHA